MVAHSDAETPGGTPQHYCHSKSLPRKEKQSRDGAGMQHNHKKSSNPNDGLGKRFVPFEGARHFHNLHTKVARLIRRRQSGCGETKRGTITMEDSVIGVFPPESLKLTARIRLSTMPLRLNLRILSRRSMEHYSFPRLFPPQNLDSQSIMPWGESNSLSRFRHRHSIA
jgi:hypothetical protein